MTVPKLSLSGPHSSCFYALLAVGTKNYLTECEELNGKTPILMIDRGALKILSVELKGPLS